MVLADFTIGVDLEPPRDVRVVVYDSVKGLRMAASRWDGSRGNFSDTLGVCHSFVGGPVVNGEHLVEPLCAIVRLAEPNLGVGIISHEMAHAAVWIRELSEGAELRPLRTGDDEEFCWLLGELVRKAINGMDAAGVYDRG